LAHRLKSTPDNENVLMKIKKKNLDSVMLSARLRRGAKHLSLYLPCILSMREILRRKTRASE
jgi:hypothetical protein